MATMDSAGSDRSGIIPLQDEALPADCYVFKHSTQCSISAGAAEQVRGYAWNRPLYWVNVIEQRPISNWIERHYQILHESPQLLSIREGKVVAVLNHRAIVRSAFAALEGAPVGKGGPHGL